VAKLGLVAYYKSKGRHCGRDSEAGSPIPQRSSRNVDLALIATGWFPLFSRYYQRRKGDTVESVRALIAVCPEIEETLWLE
jgi:hypothetical protein